ncbi:hypothetical protein DC345_02565 [Paenibacillus taichungensis]|uniref:WD40 repeat domain-containing protein n=1 Tax=Paenibacillus taichungensis TaxID=484184 RepID=A0A329R6G7_9BACL|nr:hypothetical protein [Paenibacillus taichungensis]RAW19042.1 hypothetical protein DC345_02565 [Paenibacillus taichungensis]
MPQETDRLKLPLPLGNENVTRESINGIFEKIDAGVATEKSLNDVRLSILSDYIRQPAYAVTTGVASAYIVTLYPTPDMLPDGFGITIVPHVTNETGVTLNINGLGAVPLRKQNGTPYASGDLLKGKPYSFRRVGQDFLADNGEQEVINRTTRVEVEYNADVKKGDVLEIVSIPTLSKVETDPIVNQGGYSQVSNDRKTFMTYGFYSGPFYGLYGIGENGSLSTSYNILPPLASSETIAEASLWGNYLAVTLYAWKFAIYKRSGATYTRLANLSVPPDDSYQVPCFSEDGNFLAVSTARGGWYIYNRTGDNFNKLEDNNDILSIGHSSKMRFSPDGKFFIIARNNRQGFYLFSITGNTFLRTHSWDWTGADGTISDIRFTPDSRYFVLLTSSADNGPYVFSISNEGRAVRAQIDTTLAKYMKSYRGDISPNGRMMIWDAVNSTGVAQIMNINGSKFNVFPAIKTPSYITGISFLTDELVALTHSEQRVTFYRIGSKRVAQPVLKYDSLLSAMSSGLAYALSEGKAGEIHTVMQIL